MRQFLLTCILLCAAVLAVAQVDEHATPIRKGNTDPLYLQLYGGINKSANENLPWTEFTRYPWSGGTFIGLGKEFHPLWGWRAAIRFNHNKSRNVLKCESPDTWGWHNFGFFADATFDITDACRQKSVATGSRKWNLKAFAGIGTAYTFGFDNVPLSYTLPYSRNSRMLFGFRAGLTATYQVAPKWHIGAEISQNAFTDQFNGVKGGLGLDTRTNLKLGVTYTFTHKSRVKPKYPVVYDNRLKVVPALPFAIPEEEKEKVRTLSGRAFIDFVVDRTEIKPGYRHNAEELHHIIATIDSAFFDKSITIKSISLHGYASPESPYQHNEELSRGRVVALRDYLCSHYKLRPDQFTLNHTAEDWPNLREFIALGDRRTVKDGIWYESLHILETPETPDFVLNHRDELLHVIDLEMDPDEKELLLKQVGDGEPYRWLLKYVYPGLRHTDYTIEYVVKRYPTLEGRRLIYTHPHALSLEEMYHVAHSYAEGSDEWLDALLIAAKHFPDDPKANLNAACACVMVKRLNDAKHYLSCAGNSDEAKYVSDVISAMEGSAKWKLVNGRLVIE